MPTLSSFHRGRRLRRTEGLRSLIREHSVGPADLVQPYFVMEHSDPGFRQEVPSMPGQEQLGLDALEERIRTAVSQGLHGLILFGIPSDKDERGSSAYREDGIIQQAVGRIKHRFPDLTVITDVCLCEYTSHGHCGIVEHGRVDNDRTLELLAATAVSHARAGADVIAPSDMMDGRIAAIREALDREGFQELPVLSYAVKYASSFYGPFRDAAHSAPSFGDRRTYQMDPANSREALREARADLEEGADVIMVKPALPYLDIVRDLRCATNAPVAAYQVSGEYSMIKAAAERGWIDEEGLVLESLLALKRAGADLIVTYYAERALAMLREDGA
jgi:porphobilinogen synthase